MKERYMSTNDYPTTAGNRRYSIAEISGGKILTPADWAELEEDDSTTAKKRFSVGLPSLDYTLSPRPNQVPGCFAPGEQTVIIGDTGHGKSSFVRRNIYRNCTLDNWGWGFPDRKTVVLVTEENPARIAEATEMHPKGRLRHIGDRSVRVFEIGSSRKAIGVAILRCAYEACVQSHDTGRPVTDFLPEIVALDYDQAVSEDKDGIYTTERVALANLMLRGIANWNLGMIEQWSGASWKEVCKEFTYFKGNAPDFPGEGEHKVATVTTAQVKARDNKNTQFSPGVSDPADFTYYEDGIPFWEPKAGSARLLGRDDYQGDKQALKDATNVWVLYRLFPNTGIVDLKDGRKVSSETSAYVIIDKARYGQRSRVVELAFSSSPDGKVGQWYDINAEEAVAMVEAGVTDYDRPWKWDWDRRWRIGGFGSPILPKRPHRSQVDGIPYRLPTAEEIEEYERERSSQRRSDSGEPPQDFVVVDANSDVVPLPEEAYETPDFLRSDPPSDFDPSEWYSDEEISYE